MIGDSEKNCTLSGEAGYRDLCNAAKYGERIVQQYLSMTPIRFYGYMLLSLLCSSRLCRRVSVFAPIKWKCPVIHGPLRDTRQAMSIACHHLFL